MTLHLACRTLVPSVFWRSLPDPRSRGRRSPLQSAPINITTPGSPTSARSRLSHENAAKGVLIRSELNSLMAKVSESSKQIEVPKAGLEGQGTMITKLQKRAQPVDEEDTNIAGLAGTPMTNPQAKKKKSKKNATPATAPPSTRSPRIAAKQLARAEGSK